MGAAPALDDGLHVPRAPRRGDLPVQEPALAKAGDGIFPSDFFRRNVVLSFQEDAIGIRLRDVIGVDNMMWGSDYPHSESTFPRSRKILAEILAGVPDDEQAKIAGGNTARVYKFDVARLTVPTKLASGSADPTARMYKGRANSHYLLKQVTGSRLDDHPGEPPDDPLVR